MVEVSRRSVLGGAVSAVGLAALGLKAADPARATGSRAVPTNGAGRVRSTRSAPLRAEYAGSVGHVFRLEHGSRAVRMSFASVQSLQGTTSGQHAECFMLIFTPTGRARLHDGMYSLRHRGVRTHRLFLSRVGTDGAMQAIINRQVR